MLPDVAGLKYLLLDFVLPNRGTGSVSICPFKWGGNLNLLCTYNSKDNVKILQRENKYKSDKIYPNHGRPHRSQSESELSHCEILQE